MSNKMYPIILGNKRDNNPTKVGICGMPPGMNCMDLFILGLKEGIKEEDILDKTQLLKTQWDGHVYVQLRFVSIEAIDKTIKMLEAAKEQWEKQNTIKKG